MTPVAGTSGRNTFKFLFCQCLSALTKRQNNIVVAYMVADMEVDMVADMEVDIVAELEMNMAADMEVDNVADIV